MFGLVPFGNLVKNDVKDNSGFNSLLDVFDEPFFNNLFAPVNQAVKSFKVDVKDTGDAYELTAELPGVKKEDISLNYDNGYLTIKTVEAKNVEDTSTKTDDKDAKDTKDAKAADEPKYVRRERYFGSKERSFYIDNIDEANTKAEYKDGILKVVLPKATKKEASTKIDIA